MEKMKETNFLRFSKFSKGMFVRTKRGKTCSAEIKAPAPSKQNESGGMSGEQKKWEQKKTTVGDFSPYIQGGRRSEIRRNVELVVSEINGQQLRNRWIRDEYDLLPSFPRFSPPLASRRISFGSISFLSRCSSLLSFALSFSILASFTWFMRLWLAEHFAYLILNLAS